LDEAAAIAKQVLALATPTPTDGLHSAAAFEANIVLGKAALRDGNKRQAVQYMMAAAASPDSDQLRQSGGFGYSFSPGAMNMNLMRALVDWGERSAVADFLDKMAPKIKRTREFQQWAADIRKGLNPDLIPTRGGCKVGPC